jgi:DNA-directed RNA polymerase specialized sigma24 family protein
VAYRDRVVLNGRGVLDRLTRAACVVCRELPTQQQAVFALHYDGYGDKEIAEILGMKSVTARSHLRHARENLRAWWDRESSDSPGREETVR